MRPCDEVKEAIPLALGNDDEAIVVLARSWSHIRDCNACRSRYEEAVETQRAMFSTRPAGERTTLSHAVGRARALGFSASADVRPVRRLSRFMPASMLVPLSAAAGAALLFIVTRQEASDQLQARGAPVSLAVRELCGVDDVRGRRVVDAPCPAGAVRLFAVLVDAPGWVLVFVEREGTVELLTTTPVAVSAHRPFPLPVQRSAAVAERLLVVFSTTADGLARAPDAVASGVRAPSALGMVVGGTVRVLSYGGDGGDGGP